MLERDGAGLFAWLWTSYRASQYLSFLIYKVNIIIPTLKDDQSRMDSAGQSSWPVKGSW